MCYPRVRKVNSRAPSPSRYGVIEVDEKYLVGVAQATDPKSIALLNLSRDQLDRAAETRMLAENWREGLAGSSKAVVVANADDPLVVWAASSSPNVIWVAAGQMWKDDAWSCPSCGGVMQRPGDDWFCGECGFRRPTASWALSGDHVLDPHGSAWPIHLQLPGRANKANAASSAAVAAVFGVPPQVALERMYQVQAVAGRYDVVQFQGRDLRLLLAKNPAGWLETFSLIDPPPAPVILSVNARGADGTDTSWLWDVDYTRLSGHPICVVGDREAGPRGASGGREPAVPGAGRGPRPGGAAVPAGTHRGHRELHRLPGPAPPRRQLIRETSRGFS
ncbi:Lipid II isoglutaminyl synthase (glutamine-hydrolyzing) subunit MurT [Streptomyces tendae]